MEGYELKHFIKDPNIRLVTEKSSNTNFVVKYIVTNQSNYYNELYITKLLNHPNIIHIHEIIENFDQQTLFIMEYCPLGDLFNKLIGSTYYISESVAKKWCKDMASALSYIHSIGIIHRDVKPENILVTENGLKLTDFGLSTQITLTETLSEVCGTPRYLAPEIILIAKPELSIGTLISSYTFAVDIWSFGVTLYFILCKRFPFNNNLYKSIIKGNFIFTREISFNAKKLIFSMLKVDVNKRFTIEQVLADIWLQ